MKTAESSLKAVAVLALVVAVAGSPAGAAQIEKKFRVSLQIGGTNALDEIQSDAGNRLILVDSDFSLTHIFTDPRDDSSVFGSLEMKAATGAQAAVQYGLSKIFLVELSVGYFKTDVFEAVIPRDVVLAEASSHGVPAYYYAPLSRGAWSYIEAAKEVLDHAWKKSPSACGRTRPRSRACSWSSSRPSTGSAASA